MTMRPTCMSCQNDLIGQDEIWSYLLETLLIGWSDGSVFWRLLLTSFYFLFRDFIEPFAINKKRYANASSFCGRYAVQSAVDAQNRQNDRHLWYLLYLWWGFKTVHYANDVAWFKRNGDWAHCHTDQIPFSSNQIPSEGLQTDHLPSRPIISIGRTFGRTSDEPSSVSSNQTLRTDFQTDHLPSSPIKSFRVSSKETLKRFKSF